LFVLAVIVPRYRVVRFLDRVVPADFRFAAGLPVFFLFAGTLAPFFRASDNPMAIACFRLVTFFPDPLFSVPFFLRFIALFTVLCAFLPYFAITLQVFFSQNAKMLCHNACRFLTLDQ
jgi:hypothetical protein